MDAPTADELVEMALEYFAARGLDVELGDGGLTDPDGRVFGLEPLRRRLADIDPSEWVPALESHFDLLLTVDPAQPERFEPAAPNLRSAVIAASDLGLFDGALMERPLVEGLGERLMLRKGPLAMTVTTEVVDGWQVDPGLVWDKARDGSLWDEPAERIGFQSASAGFTAVRGGRWTSTRVLAMERYVDPTSPYGALVAVPARDEVLYHRIEGRSFTDAALAMLEHAAASFLASPLPVGCDLFWWRSGRLWRICRPGDDHYHYIRVPEFSAMLWELEEATGAVAE
ncbi:MAG: hypothetical protein WB239_13410 [Acidimicrobiia bacterium]